MGQVQCALISLIICRYVPTIEASDKLKRACFTKYSDFAPGSLEGDWFGLTEEEWEVEERTGRRQKYGNMTCPFEEENKACGRQVGSWKAKLTDDNAILMNNENADYSLNHMILRPYRCDIQPFDAIKLLKVLGKGNRTLYFKGDSTMRQIYDALLCSIPSKNILSTYFEKKQSGILLKGVVELLGGGRIVYDSFPHGEKLFIPEGTTKFDPGYMAHNLFGDCPSNSICVKRPTLHFEVDVEEVAAFHNAAFLDILKSSYSQPNPDIGWSIVLAPSAQHFVQLPGSSESKKEVKESTMEKNGRDSSVKNNQEHKVVETVEGHEFRVENGLMFNDDSTCGGSGQYYQGAFMHTGEKGLCKAQVCPPARDLALNSLLELKLPLAIIGGDMLYNQGYGHVLVEKFMQHDCTHWCAPGVSDALLATILSLIITYDGNQTEFATQIIMK